MDQIILNAISEILEDRKDFLKIVVRQKAKFEGWLKFELAHYLENIEMSSVEVETINERSRSRSDITLLHEGNFYKIELKTPNTNWKIKGINSNSRPITKNIKSIIEDAKKLNSNYGIVAFVLFPIPQNDKRWEKYIDLISEETKIIIDKEIQCKQLTLNIDEINRCNILICAFKSRKFTNWY